MSSEVDIALLEQYLAEEIDRSQVLSVDGEPISDDALDVAIKDYEETVLSLEGAALKNQLKVLHETLDLREKKSAFPRWLAVAASIVLITVFGTLIWQSKNSTPEFTEYFDHFDQLVTFRNSDSTDYSAGLEAYSERNYAEAYILLERVDSLSDELKFYHGLSALGSEDFEKAISLFEILGTSSSNKYYQQTRWYLALAYWQAGLVAKAQNLLDEIEAGEFKYQESLKLIDKLRD